MKTFRTRLRARYAETDATGIVYYNAYFVYFEVGRVELFRELGLPYDWRLPIVEARCRYHASAVFDDVLEVQSEVEEIRTRAFRIAQRVYRVRGEGAAAGAPIAGDGPGAARLPRATGPAAARVSEAREARHGAAEAAQEAERCEAFLEDIRASSAQAEEISVSYARLIEDAESDGEEDSLEESLRAAEAQIAALAEAAAEMEAAAAEALARGAELTALAERLEAEAVAEAEAEVASGAEEAAAAAPRLELLAEGHTVMMTQDETGPIPLPAEFRVAFEQAMAASDGAR